MSSSGEGRVTGLTIYPLTDVAACDEATIHWLPTGKPNEEDSSLIRIWAASNDYDTVNLTKQFQNVIQSAGTSLGSWVWPRVNVPPGEYRFLITDEESQVNATSKMFEILPPKNNDKSCYSSTAIYDPVPGPHTGNSDSSSTQASTDDNSSDEPRVTDLFIAPLNGVAACGSATIDWQFDGKPNEEDHALIRIWPASDESSNFNFTEQVQLVSSSVGTELRRYDWKLVNVPPGEYRFSIVDEESQVNATSSKFEILPPKDKPDSCYSTTDITQPIPGPHTGGKVTTSNASNEAKPKAQTIAPSVIVPVVVVMVVLLGLLCWRRRSRSAAQSRRWTILNSFLTRHGIYRDSHSADAAGGKEKRRRRKKDKVSVALPSTPMSAAARQTSARQLNETDLGPYGFVSHETDSYPMHDRGAHRRPAGRPSSFRSTTSTHARGNERSLKDFMLYDSNESDAYDDDGMDDEEDFKVIHSAGFYDANRGSLLPSGTGGKMLVVPGSGSGRDSGSGIGPRAEEAEPLLRHGDGSDRLAQSRPRPTRRGEERALISSLRDEEEMGILSNPSHSSTSYAQSNGSADDYGRSAPGAGSQAHLFTGSRRGYGDSEGYGDIPPSLLPTSTFSLRPPTSAVTRQHHHEAHLGASPSADPRPLTSKRSKTKSRSSGLDAY